MDTDRVHAVLPEPPSQIEEEKVEEKAIGNFCTELESVDLPLGTTLRLDGGFSSCLGATYRASSARPALCWSCSHNCILYITIMADNETLECVTEHERILQEIESTDTACVGPTLRTCGSNRQSCGWRADL
ncbi:hypothetical protein ILYODFUR_033623 [Ilyodon furcidens]|uniref:Uncharacterized protein n=1 Tax=Ilyodon furcidens TaxID=33524 RepID=A0ABV0TEE0_9TELE